MENPGMENRGPVFGNARDVSSGVVTEIAEWIHEYSGIATPADRLKFEIFQKLRSIDGCQGRVYYGGPMGHPSKHSMPKIKLDLTADEVPVTTLVRHDFSDDQLDP